MRTGRLAQETRLPSLLCSSQMPHPSAGERERLAGERLRAANSRAASSMAALQAVQSEVADSARSCQAEYRLRMDAEARAQRLEAQLAQVLPLMPAVRPADERGRAVSNPSTICCPLS